MVGKIRNPIYVTIDKILNCKSKTKRFNRLIIIVIKLMQIPKNICYRSHYKTLTYTISSDNNSRIWFATYSNRPLRLRVKKLYAALLSPWGKNCVVLYFQSKQSKTII